MLNDTGFLHSLLPNVVFGSTILYVFIAKIGKQLMLLNGNLRERRVKWAPWPKLAPVIIAITMHSGKSTIVDSQEDINQRHTCQLGANPKPRVTHFS